MGYNDQKGSSIEQGQDAKIQIACGDWKTGVVLHTIGGLVTVRCNITENNPDGTLYSAAPKKTIVMIP